MEAARPPAPVEPVPASVARELRGRRVIVGLPGLGWRTDLRADETVVQGSRTYVPVLPEQEWYRAEAEQTEVFAPLVPIERVWVETLNPSAVVDSNADLVSRLVSLDRPPVQLAVPVREAHRITGRRLVRVPAHDEKRASDRRDLRAVTEPHTTADGDICVRVSSELDWYRWAWSGQPPKTLAVPVHLLWVE
jgi:hypothetical protein